MINRLNMLFIKRKEGLRVACLLLLAASCKRSAPEIEPDVLPVERPMHVQPAIRAPLPNRSLWGFVAQEGTSYLNATLQLLARLYPEEVSNGKNQPLKELVACFINTNRWSEDRYLSLLHAFRKTLPEPYKSSTQEEDIVAFLQRLHEYVPFLGEVKQVAYSPYAAYGSKRSENITHWFSRPILCLTLPMDQKTDLDMSRCIREQKSKNEAIDHLPEKLCIALERKTVDLKKKSSWNSVNLNGTASITIQQDAARYFSKGYVFDLAAFLVSTERIENQPLDRIIVAFLKLENNWYCINNEKVTPITEAEALHASKQSSVLFYQKRP
ncbi:MAG TPA: hypothetical protein VK133_02950 [Amoebophilaceae bacterium]|jgi:hypothetical protein|nr:hypothetical protein [Amoebophilaceae bacterium]